MAYYIAHRHERYGARLIQIKKADVPWYVSNGWVLDRVSADYARAWVKQDRLHETPLYVDGDRVRYAKDNSDQ